jgi:hypothetical protein
MFRYNFGNGRYNVTAHGESSHVTIFQCASVRDAEGLTQALNASLAPYLARPLGELLGDPGYLASYKYGGTDTEAV